MGRQVGITVSGELTVQALERSRPMTERMIVYRLSHISGGLQLTDDFPIRGLASKHGFGELESWNIISNRQTQ